MTSAATTQEDGLTALYGGVGNNGALPQSTDAPSPLPSAMLPSLAGEKREQQQQAKKVGWWAWLKGSVKKLKREVLALHYATQDKRLGSLPRATAVLALAYALSPMDLMPDFIPILGIIDDVLILGNKQSTGLLCNVNTIKKMYYTTALLYFAVRLVPEDVMHDARLRAQHEPLRLRKNWGMALLFFLMWDTLLLALVWWVCGIMGQSHPQISPYKMLIVVGCGVVAVAAELAWGVKQWRKEARLQAALTAAGTHPELQEALLRGGSEAIQAYLEP